MDLRRGQCVRLLRGDFGRATSYSDDPVATARSFRELGATRLHVVDLDAARGDGDNRAVIREVAALPGVAVQVAGGIRDLEVARAWIRSGAEWVVVGTVAVEAPSEAERIFRDLPGQALLAVDVRGSTVRTRGWEESTALGLDAVLGSFAHEPPAALIVTSIERDGGLEGPDLELIRQAVRAFPGPVVASGGIRDLDDLAACEPAGASAAIVGRAIYEGRLDLAAALRRYSATATG
ncbi:MAG: 1-(5-phosphoribosyl)-5-[(5-phosphoribosylamino)methylideneamino]imidazole-4-carboxamide isomerase [Candidatus Dormibacteria bacterium]